MRMRTRDNDKTEKLLLVNDGGLETLGGAEAENGDGIGVKLLLGSLVVVTLALKTHTKTAGEVLDTVLPYLLVELGVETDVLGAHGLLGESDDLLDGAGSTLLEGNVVDALVKVDGVLAGYNIVKSRAGLLALLRLVLVVRHLWIKKLSAIRNAS